MLHPSHLVASRKPFIFLFIIPLLIYAGVLLLVSPHISRAAGTTYYVAANGDDGNPGTQSAPFRTVTKGMSVLVPGDTLYVRAGTYTETPVRPPSGTASQPVTIAR
jgi:Protein of unknown function (DUF1565)